MKTLAVILVLCAPAPACGQEVVRVATEGAFPPFNFVNDSGELDGFDIEVGRALCARAQVTCEWVQNEWDSIIPNLVSGNYDAIMAAMNITPERDAVIDFTEPYYPAAPSAYVALSEEADVFHGVVAAQASTVHAAHVAATGATLVEFGLPEDAVAAVSSGEADAAFADRDFLAPLVEASGGALVIVGEPVPIGQGFGIGLRESDAPLTARFDRALAAMKADGSLDAALAKWFGEDAPSF